MSGLALSRRAAIAGVAGLALAAPGRAAAQSRVEQLERLLALEQRLAAVYETALARDAIDPALGETLLEHEREHVRGLEKALPGGARREPRAVVTPPGPAFGSRPAFARYAAGLELETVAAYVEVLATLDAERLLQPLGSIMAAGAQHVVALREAAGEDLLALA